MMGGYVYFLSRYRLLSISRGTIMVTRIELHFFLIEPSQIVLKFSKIRIIMKI
jgi:hypothetical protein